MRLFYLLLTSLFVCGNTVRFDFTQNSDLSNWIIADDVVMGGHSWSKIDINQAGHAEFYGRVSLENKGGFSSVRYRFDQKNVEGSSKMMILLKGDGKRYQFRLKSDEYECHSYMYQFQTTGDWQTIEVPLRDMAPTFGGRQLNMPNYPVEILEEIAFLIANNTAETFKLEIDKINLR